MHDLSSSLTLKVLFANLLVYVFNCIVKNNAIVYKNDNLTSYVLTTHVAFKIDF